MVNIIQTEKNGKTFFNLQLKSGKTGPGLNNGETVTIIKEKYAQSKPVSGINPITKQAWTLHSCTGLYQGQLVSFALFDNEEALQWDETGGLGDAVKISMKYENYTNKKTGKPSIKETLTFELDNK